MLPDYDDATLQQQFGLSYHIQSLRLAEEMIGLSGQRVLEVGGNLPRSLVIDIIEAKRWTGLESKDYWRYFGSADNIPGGQSAEMTSFRDRALNTSLLERDYAVLDCPIEVLPTAFDQQFDRIFSVATFEHLDRLPAALDRMYDALVPGGRLYALAAPVWSSAIGHHLPEIRDDAGNVWSQGNPPIPPWGHLLMRPSQMLDHLATRTDTRAAREIVHQIYHAPFINRLFTEDYIQLVKQSSFRLMSVQALFQRDIPPAMQELLERYHPGHANFANEGLLIVLERQQ